MIGQLRRSKRLKKLVESQATKNYHKKVKKNVASVDSNAKDTKENESKASDETHEQKLYYFKEPLIRGIILSRPNRFVMQVLVNNRVARCHCPCTGTIAQLDFKRIEAFTNDGAIKYNSVKNGIPCLLSKAISKNAKTEFTVEAISLRTDPQCSFTSNLSKKSRDDCWVGINQVQANRFIEHFLMNGRLSNLLKYNSEDKSMVLQREKKLITPVSNGNEKSAKKNMKKQSATKNNLSRIDFCLSENHYIEVKSPLNWIIPEARHPLYQPTTGKVSWLSERLVKHHGAMRDFLLGKDVDNSKDKNPSPKILEERRCSVIVVFMYDAVQFRTTDSESLPVKIEKQKMKMISEKRNDKATVNRNGKRPKACTESEKYTDRLNEVLDVIREAQEAGLKTYQVNLKVTPQAVDIIRTFELPNLR